MITRHVKVDVTPTVTEVADAVWDMSSQDQLTFLSCLDTRFFQIPFDGNNQLAFMFYDLQKLSPEKKERVKHMVKALYQYLVEEDNNSEIEEIE